MNKRPLVVLVPDYRGMCDSMLNVKKVLKQEPAYSNALWLEFNYRPKRCIHPVFNNRNPELIASNLAATIDGFYAEHEDNVSEIILCGYSLGTTILRRAFLNASGFGHGFGSPPQAWSHRVSRIVLISAIGRGVNFRHIRSWSKIITSPLLAISKIAPFFGGTLKQVMRGADFITNLRIDWIRFNVAETKLPPVVHLLGALDEIVVKEDVIDIEQFSNAIPVLVPGATHFGILEQSSVCRTPITQAFNGDITATRTCNSGGPNSIFFLLHGIRDSKECFGQVKKAIKRRLGHGDGIRVPSYGRFPIMAFLSSRRRNAKLPWFADEYAEALARNPHANFYFSGHSNGTYVVGELLKRYPGIAFKHVYLAGTVLPTGFPWYQIIDQREQVSLLRCDKGSEDWPVGVLAKTLYETGLIRSIGSGGVDDFKYDGDKLCENKFSGGHSVMLKGTERVNSIADFLLDGKPFDGVGDQKPQSSFLFRFFHKYGLFVIPIILLALTALICILGFVPNLILSKEISPAGPWAAITFVIFIFIFLERY